MKEPETFEHGGWVKYSNATVFALRVIAAGRAVTVVPDIDDGIPTDEEFHQRYAARILLERGI